MDNERQHGINPGYAAFQLAKALTTCKENPDPAVRERAKEKIAKWQSVLNGALSGSIAYGSRTPLQSIPAWLTPEVVTGGFATGELLAGGPFQEHELDLLRRLSIPAEPGNPDRRSLNAYFLTDPGISELRDLLSSGRYELSVPEEGALMVVAWLLDNGHPEEARGLIDELLPYFDRARFYPAPSSRQRHPGSRVHLQDAGKTLSDIEGIKPNKRILAQREAARIWAPLHDRVVGLFLETVEDGWPCRKYPAGWRQLAQALIQEYAVLRMNHPAGGKHHRAAGYQAQLRGFLERAAEQKDPFRDWEIRRVRSILDSYVAKRGVPGSERCEEERRQQWESVSRPMFHELASVVARRLSDYPGNEGVDDIAPLVQSVTHGEASSRGLPEGTPMPRSIQRKVERCLNAPIDLLVERGLITSGETLARVLPQITAGIRAAGIMDPRCRELYGALYQAFRRRRSLLLLDLETQVRFEELPWIAVLDPFRRESASTEALSKQTLDEVASLTLASFPQAIVPNKLLQEFRTLAQGAKLRLPFVDEVAADIFMGRFSDKFVEAALIAASHLDGSLYARYFGIHYPEIVRKWKAGFSADRDQDKAGAKAKTENGFAAYCASRAGVALLKGGFGKPAINGMVIEQQQILTTQNLAALFFGAGLRKSLQEDLARMAERCFQWICRRQQVKASHWHDRLITVKNTAYAWRQMVFYLALLPDREAGDFLKWAEQHLAEQPERFRVKFRPALQGLIQVANGHAFESDSRDAAASRRFLGWSESTHWLMADASQ